MNDLAVKTKTARKQNQIWHTYSVHPFILITDLLHCSLWVYLSLLHDQLYESALLGYYVPLKENKDT